ncbi:ROK family transcriptional regulator [Fodinicola acaciae]|uniref:ROK family transcriptional regulator n=1 Tax=Fodinicola acaciae TaxID=2681555 RepID=UPI0013D01693|nr:ROK family transcriptional regulator [Fodinicola acaciae]
MIVPRAAVPAGDLNRLRQINEHAVLAAIRTGGDLRLAELVERTGLTRASLAEVIRGLTDRCWVVAEEPYASGRGRPAQRFRFNAAAGHVVGVDIGAYAIRAAVADLAGTVVARAERAVNPDDARTRRLAATAATIDDALGGAGLGRGDVWLVGAGTTGQLAPDGKVLLSSAITDWSGADLPAELTELLELPVVVENDAWMRTLAEQRIGAAQGISDLIVLQAGRRLGVTLVLDGRIRCGHSGMAGDVSVFNALNGDAAIEHILACSVAARTGDHIHDVATAAIEGDANARKAMRRYTRAIGEVAAIAVSLVDPEMLLLTGVFASYAQLVVPDLTAELELRCMSTPRVAVSGFGAEAVPIGAVWYALDHLAGRLFAADTLPALANPYAAG